MPGPPPPPPPAGGPPPPPVFNMPPPSGNPNDRSALLKSIQKGTKLKKAVTVDKSAPMIPGKVSSVISNNNSNSGSYGSDKPAMSVSPMVNGLGALFSEGIPKLKPVKSLGATSTSNHAPAAPASNNNNNFVNTQKQIRMQIKASDNKNRGPPPPAPVRAPNPNSIKDYPAPKKFPMAVKNGNPNPIQFNTSVPNLHGINAEPNRSTLHKKAMSNSNLGSMDSTDTGRNADNVAPRVTNFGKPQLAPKPPPINGRPSLKRVSLNRTQSMHSPRSPSPQSPGINDKMKFGTVRNMKAGFMESLESIHQQAVPRPPITERPKAPPPSIPNTPPPPSKTVIKHPGHAPPPPPPSMAPPEMPPAQAPPPLPHRTPPQVPRSAPMSNGSSAAPIPPPRFSSMKDVGDFEARFADKFHDVSDFPSPMPFRGIEKVYLGIQVFSNKQQAPPPPPPNHLQLNNRLWDSSTC